MFKEKTIVVTGATGLLGSNLIKELIARDAKVIAIGRSEEKLKGCFEDYIKQGTLSYCAKDISLGLDCFEIPVDYIFHAAGSIELNNIVNYPIDVVNPNIIGTIKCLDFLRNQEETTGKKGRLIYFSSEAVYGRSLEDAKVSEDDTELSDGINYTRAPYSQSKRMAEVIVNGYVKQFDVDALCVRFSWVYGNAKYRPKQALFDFIKSALNGEDIIIKNPRSARRDNIFMNDALNGLLTVAEKGIAGEAYNISSGDEMGNYASPDEIAELITMIVNKKKYSNKTVKVVYELDHGKREGGIIMKNDKLKALGWSLDKSLSDGLEILIDEVRNNVY